LIYNIFLLSFALDGARAGKKRLPCLHKMNCRNAGIMRATSVTQGGTPPEHFQAKQLAFKRSYLRFARSKLSETKTWIKILLPLGQNGLRISA
jgi:hypothetical protein